MRDQALQSLRDAIPASDSLKAQAAHYIGIFEALPIPALLLDATGTVIDVNEAFVEFGHQIKPLEFDSDRIGILEREQAESALRESEEKLRSVVENAPDYIMTLDLDGRILYTNRMPQGLDAGQLADASIFDATKAEYEDALMGAVDQIATERGRHALRHAREGLDHGWRMRQERRSQRYTTRWDELPVAT